MGSNPCLLQAKGSIVSKVRRLVRMIAEPRTRRRVSESHSPANHVILDLPDRTRMVALKLTAVLKEVYDVATREI